MRFRVWAPPFDEDAEFGRDIEAVGPLQAAESYARKMYEAGNIDGMGSVDVSVSDEAGVITEFAVSIDSAPTFRARLKTAGAR